MEAPHEALAKELSCPVCLELFTPPVLELPCGHNYCKQCIEATLFSQNCTHVNGHFYCPMCKKMCLQDDVPICSICKLFGDHQCHEVARLSDVYQERKKCFAEDMQSLHLRNESISGTIQEVEKQLHNNESSCRITRLMIDAVGGSLLEQLKSKMDTLKLEVESEKARKAEKLQGLLATLNGPPQLYLQMKRLLDSHLSAAHFLREDKLLRAEVDRLSWEVLPQVAKGGSGISTGHYFKELLKGIDVKDFSTLGARSALLEEMGAWASTCSNPYTSPDDNLDQVIHKIMLNLGVKGSGTDEDEDYESFLSSSSHFNNTSQELEEEPMERIDL
ncbi:tripartite motif-containing protein 54-like isoform X2 [Narcine bancroftii]|uniref:tripartite motif-containing protein 54-like isoform X2 n=1 Tax=Narcine bancroftii TaxID=1343680 RepID=UPI0038319890